VAIPVKLPAPEAGTAEQPEPKSVVVALEDEDEGIADEGIADADAEVDPAAAVLLELLLQAAAPRAMPAAAAETARVR
jgi:hypothetical protein